MTETKFCPKARTENLVSLALDKELLLYDLTTNKGYSLNETSALIWQSCDGKTSFDEVKKQIEGLTDELILLALTDFQKGSLLEDKSEIGFFETQVSRRKVLVKYATAAFALPVIISFVAPQSVHAQSTCLLDNVSFTITSIDTNNCFSPANINRCCSKSISFTAFDGISTVSCTCGVVVIP